VGYYHIGDSETAIVDLPIHAKNSHELLPILSISPIRREVLFTDNGQLSLISFDSNPSRVVRLSPTGATDTDAAWSLDGDSIIISRERGGVRSLVVISRSGQERPAVTQGTLDSQPFFSPDGNKIAFLRKKDNNASPDLFTHDLVTQEEKMIASNVAAFAFEADGSLLVNAFGDVSGETIVVEVFWADGTSQSVVSGLKSYQRVSPLGNK
jgi:Tol biopolymer transport system component